MEVRAGLRVRAAGYAEMHLSKLPEQVRDTLLESLWKPALSSTESEE